MAMIDDLKTYYADLLIKQYKEKTRARSTIKLLVGSALADLIFFSIRDAFNIDSAEGVQLDLIGEYVGVSRRGTTFTKAIELDDAEYKELIQVAIVLNNSDGTLFDIQSLLNIFFFETLLVFDYQNMRLSYLFDSSIGSEDLAEMFVINKLLPKPTGVELSSLIYSNDVTQFFGYRTYGIETANNSGFNSYGSYETDWPWLKHSNAIII